MAAGSTYTPIATTTLASPTPSYTFSSISGIYTDLVLVASLKADSTAFDTAVRFNSDSGSNYSFTSMNGTGSTAQSFRASNQTSMAVDRQATVSTTSFVVQILNVMNYANSTTYKSCLARNSALWMNQTDAITSISFAIGGSIVWTANSSFALYGIKGA